MPLDFVLPESPVYSSPTDIRRVHENPGFGQAFTDHMALATWTSDQGWHGAAVHPYGPLPIDPAASALHYAQEVFEGLKAYRHVDGSVWSFRPEANALRFAQSARRLALPELSGPDFMASITALVEVDQAWVPSGAEKSLYLRPFMFANEPYLGIRPAHTVTYCLIASPVGSYFPSGVRPVDIWVTSEYSRAAPGGTGAAKCGGNYAASLLAQQEAADHDCSQVLFIDAVERKWVEELGGMNVYLVTAAGELITPELTGTILEGVTRSSILQLADKMNLNPVERRISLAEVFDGIASGAFTEMFACGTAAVVTPIRSLRSADVDVVFENSPGEVTMMLREHLLDVQYGRREDEYGWLSRLV